MERLKVKGVEHGVNARTCWALVVVSSLVSITQHPAFNACLSRSDDARLTVDSQSLEEGHVLPDPTARSKPDLRNETRAASSNGPEAVERPSTYVLAHEEFTRDELWTLEANSDYTWEAPVGWSVTPDGGKHYMLRSDYTIVWSGAASARLTSVNGGYQFGAFAQAAPAGEFLNKRLEMRAMLRVRDASAGAALWFRAEDAFGEVIAFDNMATRRIRGTTSWEQHSLVIDIPRQATVIIYGAVLYGRGSLWLDNVEFEMVGTETPITGPVFMPRPEIRNQPIRELAPSPTNLDFENTRQVAY